MAWPTGFPNGSRGGSASDLPIQLTRFVGREMVEITGHLASARLLTLTGPGWASERPAS
jgi:hypothetical protein